ncbi:putative signal-transduction protein with CBS domains [Staphylothermus marinus F1]|uniref:Signal-transduction protein with CBS domains n=1 Tax=Staphylothermus marinus (strain ATCC 43588 / DSM 3639 / JCM 9404 / F1) TaxID=399550 RepID=A3DP36_STAMF|nr:CBS domain-containing protein [Staphylothermus marinus]ABN70396.1 putative signal-transduction protein with CBS domains [Staphylothermus marinus F1]
MSEEYLLKAYDIMTPEIRFIDKNSPIKEAALRMINEGIGALIVVDQEGPIGIVTKRDIIWGVLFEKRDPEKEPVEKIMSTPLIMIDSSSDIVQILDLMIRNNISHLPVREGDKVIGMISDMDLLEVFRDVIEIVNARRIKK